MLTQTDREKMAAYVVANCAYCDDEAVENMSDDELRIRFSDLETLARAQVVVNATSEVLGDDFTEEDIKRALTNKKAFPGAAPPFKKKGAKAGDDEEEEEEEVENDLKLNIRRKPMTEDEWLEGAPASIVEAVSFARNQQSQHKAHLIEQIVENARREDDRQFIDGLKARTIEDLEVMNSLVERPKREITAPVTNFFGQSVAASPRARSKPQPLPSNAEYEVEMSR